MSNNDKAAPTEGQTDHSDGGDADAPAIQPSVPQSSEPGSVAGASGDQAATDSDWHPLTGTGGSSDRTPGQSLPVGWQLRQAGLVYE